MKWLFLQWFILSLYVMGCAQGDDGVNMTMDRPIPYPVYQGEIEIENRSQFDFTALYFHSSPNQERLPSDNILDSVFEPGEVIQVEIQGPQYMTAIRPRVDRGPLWKIQSTQPVNFYAKEGDPKPQLWILDQGFMVIDTLSRGEP